MRLPFRLLLALLMPILAFIGLLAWPQPMFAHHATYRNYDVWSDRPIDPAIRTVLDDATRRLRRSELYDPAQRFRIFLCNDDWRLALYSQHFSSRMGGLADDWLTRNIYLREADIAANRLIPPWGELADPHVRPLSYFIAHEATHIMDSRRFGRLVALRYPAWVREGYADYVGKGGQFDYAANRKLLIAGSPLLDPARSGLYRRHHLLVAYLLDRRGWSVDQLYNDSPPEARLIRQLKSDG